MIKPHWILQRTPNKRLLGASVKRRGKVFHCAAVKEIADSVTPKGKACFCIDSNKTVVEVTDLPLLKKNILRLQVKSKIEQLAIFDVNEAISVSYQTIQQQAQQQSLSIVAIPEELIIEGIHDLTEAYDIEFLNCVSMPASIAGLLKQLGSEAVIVLLLTRDKAYVLGIHNGIALFIQGIPLAIGGEIDPEATTHAITVGRQNFSRNFDIETSRFLCMGEDREKVDYEELGEENWMPAWKHCLHADNEDILRYPALFGALFTGSSYSYLPEEYRLASSLRQLSTLLVFGAGIGAVILSGLSYQNIQNLTPLRSQLQNERQLLSGEIAVLRQQLPDSSNVTRINAFLNIQKKVAKQPSVSLFLQRISTVLPQNVTLVTMNITRKAGNTEQDSVYAIPVPGQSPDMEMAHREPGSKAKAEILLDQDLIVQFNCSSKGDYGRVKARFDEAIKGFSSLFSLGAVDWGYDEKSQTGYLNCELLLSGEEK
jgi:hypothetical protein